MADGPPFRCELTVLLVYVDGFLDGVSRDVSRDPDSKLVRRLDQWDLRDLETLGPLVAPSLRSGRYSPGPSGF